MINLKNITDIPVAMFVGTTDTLGDTTDGIWAKEQLTSAGDALVHYEEYNGGEVGSFFKLTFCYIRFSFYFSKCFHHFRSSNIFSSFHWSKTDKLKKVLP